MDIVLGCNTSTEKEPGDSSSFGARHITNGKPRVPENGKDTHTVEADEFIDSNYLTCMNSCFGKVAYKDTLVGPIPSTALAYERRTGLSTGIRRARIKENKILRGVYNHLSQHYILERVL